MSKRRSMNSYVKYLLIMLVCAAGGGVLGFCVAYLKGLDEIDVGVGGLLGLVRDNMLPLLVLLTMASVICNESILFRMRRIGDALPDAGDEESDILEYDLERIGNLGVIACNVFMVGSLLIVSTAYSMKYIESAVRSEGIRLIAGMGIFILHDVYIGIWQVRYVKLLQRIYPEKKGDPASRRFQEQWLESCDEAEKEAIFKGSYKTYLRMSKVFPFFAVVAMLCHLIWNTGIMAVVLVCGMWLLSSVTYCRSCLTVQKKKLRR